MKQDIILISIIQLKITNKYIEEKFNVFKIILYDINNLRYTRPMVVLLHRVRIIKYMVTYIVSVWPRYMLLKICS